MPDLQILSPDGKSQIIALDAARITLGRVHLVLQGDKSNQADT